MHGRWSSLATRGDDSTAACRATCPCRSSGEEGEGDPPLGSGRPALALCRLVHGHLQEPGQTAAGCPSRRSSLRQWWDGVSESYPPASQFQRALSPSSAHGCRSRSSSEGEGVGRGRPAGSRRDLLAGRAEPSPNRLQPAGCSPWPDPALGQGPPPPPPPLPSAAC
jgi:hypothetical protein